MNEVEKAMLLDDAQAFVQKELDFGHTYMDIRQALRHTIRNKPEGEEYENACEHSEDPATLLIEEMLWYLQTDFGHWDAQDHVVHYSIDEIRQVAEEYRNRIWIAGFIQTKPGGAVVTPEPEEK